MCKSKYSPSLKTDGLNSFCRCTRAYENTHQRFAVEDNFCLPIPQVKSIFIIIKSVIRYPLLKTIPASQLGLCAFGFLKGYYRHWKKTPLLASFGVLAPSWQLAPGPPWRRKCKKWNYFENNGMKIGPPCWNESKRSKKVKCHDHSFTHPCAW